MKVGAASVKTNPKTKHDARARRAPTKEQTHSSRQKSVPVNDLLREMEATFAKTDAELRKAFPKHGNLLIFEAERLALLIAADPGRHDKMAHIMTNIAFALLQENTTHFGQDVINSCLMSESVTSKTACYASTVTEMPEKIGAKPDNRHISEVVAGPALVLSFPPIRHLFQIETILQWAENMTDIFYPDAMIQRIEEEQAAQEAPTFGSARTRGEYSSTVNARSARTSGFERRRNVPKATTPGAVLWLRNLRASFLHTIGQHDLSENMMFPPEVMQIYGLVGTVGVATMDHLMDRHIIVGEELKIAMHDQHFELMKTFLGEHFTANEAKDFIQHMYDHPKVYTEFMNTVLLQIPAPKATEIVGNFILDRAKNDSTYLAGFSKQIFEYLGRNSNPIVFFGAEGVITPKSFMGAIRNLSETDQTHFLKAMLSVAENMKLAKHTTLFEEMLSLAGVERHSLLSVKGRESVVRWANGVKTMIVDERSEQIKAAIDVSFQNAVNNRLFSLPVYIVSEMFGRINRVIPIRDIVDVVLSRLGVSEWCRCIMGDLKTGFIRLGIKHGANIIAGEGNKDIMDTLITKPILNYAVGDSVFSDVIDTVVDPVLAMPGGASIITIFLSSISSFALAWGLAVPTSIVSWIIKSVFLIPRAINGVAGILKKLSDQVLLWAAKLTRDQPPDAIFHVERAVQVLFAGAYASVGIGIVGLNFLSTYFVLMDISAFGQMFIHQMQSYAEMTEFEQRHVYHPITSMGIPLVLGGMVLASSIAYKIKKKQWTGFGNWVWSLGDIICRYPKTVLAAVMFAEYMTWMKVDDQFNYEATPVFAERQHLYLKEWLVNGLLRFFTCYGRIEGTMKGADALSPAGQCLALMKQDGITPYVAPWVRDMYATIN